MGTASADPPRRLASKRMPMNTTRNVYRSLFACAALALGGCPGRSVAQVDPVPSPDIDKTIPVDNNRNIDILFVIDNSGSMREEQTSLTANFGNFIEVLEDVQGGLPNVHIGVVSTNTGGPPDRLECGENGDSGDLNDAPFDQPTGDCISGTEPFLVNIEGNTNYSGTLAESFSCIAELGIEGCGFETPLESMRRAFDANSDNSGFLRDDALLAVVFVTDEDDCSFRQPQRDDFFSKQEGVLGPRTSFRCFEYGITCSDNGDGTRQSGNKEGCLPEERSEFLVPVADYVSYLTGLKPQGRVIVAGIIGPPAVSPGTAGFRAQVRANPSEQDGVKGTPQLAPTCMSAAGEAAPAIRMTQFIDAFSSSKVATICDENLSGALTEIANAIKEASGSPCLAANTVQPLECEAWTEDAEGSLLFSVPKCGTEMLAPCWSEVSDPDCDDAAIKYTPRGDESAFSRFRIQCVGTAD